MKISKWLYGALCSLVLLTSMVTGGEAVKADDTGYQAEQIGVTFYGDTKTGKGFTWHTKEETRTDIRYVASANQPENFDQGIYAEGTAVKDELLGDYSHKVSLSNLTANTTYWYQVGDKELGNWSTAAQFKTAKTSGEVNFIFYDDTQGKLEEHYDISADTFYKGLETMPSADFILQGGDLVNYSDQPIQWEWLYSKSPDFWANNTVMAISGNHDATLNTFYNHFNYQVPANCDTTQGGYTSFDYQNIHFVLLDTNNLEATKEMKSEQVEWMKEDITAAKENGAKWIIVAMHKGTQTVGNHISDADVKAMREQLQPLYYSLGVDVVLTGHDHVYSRTAQLDATSPIADITYEEVSGVKTAINPTGTVYLCANSSGYKFYNPTDEAKIAANNVYPDIKFQNNKPMFTTFTVTADKLSFTSYEFNQAGDGTVTVADAYAIVKNDAQQPTIKKQPANLDVVQNQTPTLAVEAAAEDEGTLSYQWYENTTNSTVGGVAIAGATSATYQPTTADLGTKYYYVVVTNQNDHVAGTKTVNVTSQVSRVTVTKANTSGGTSGGSTGNSNNTANDHTVTKPSAPAEVQTVNPIAIYRAYNPNSGEHLYTVNKNEYEMLVALGWKAEGNGWKAASAGTEVYRLYNPNSGEHFFTTSAYEYEVVAKAGWRKEGVAFYSADSKDVAVYRLFNPNATNAGSHHFTSDASERDFLVAQGWKAEGIAFYGVF